MIWLPDGDEVSDREKQMIHSPKLMITFVWNPHGFQVVHALPCHTTLKIEIFTAAHYVRNILTEIVARREQRGEMRFVVRPDNARPEAAKVTRALCDDDVLRIAPRAHASYLRM
jgi:hypothetical protein